MAREELMRTAIVSAALVAALSWLPIQSDEEKALAVFKDHVLHLKNGDYGKAADGIHPKSLKKFKESVLRRFDFEKKESLDRRLKLLGFETWEDAEKAEPREIYVRFQKTDKDRGSLFKFDTFARNVNTVIGTLAKNGRVYIVADTKFSFEEDPVVRSQEVLFVVYKHAGEWKLATYLESNIDE
jgi:hypothetical protein